MLKVIIFNVERGFCAFILSPNKYGLLIDCGKSAQFSPIKYIITNMTQDIAKFNERYLAYTVISHPHEDHISDVKRLIDFYPAILCAVNYDWDEIKDPEHKDEYENLDAYAKWKSGLSSYEGDPIDWGMQLWRDGLSVDEAKKINSNRQAFVNNSSLAVMLEYRKWKFFFSGDIMEDGWEEILKREDFGDALKGTDFFVTSHHGHKSGFNPKIYEVMGKPFINIVSEKSGEEVYSVYSDEDHAKGITWQGETRRMFSTRLGSITIEVPDQGTPTIVQKQLDDNLT